MVNIAINNCYVLVFSCMYVLNKPFLPSCFLKTYCIEMWTIGLLVSLENPQPKAAEGVLQVKD